MEPMEPQQLLALLTAHVQRFHLAPGGIPGITPQDIAYKLSKLGNLASWYCRLKYCDQHEYAERVIFGRRPNVLGNAVLEDIALTDDVPGLYRIFLWECAERRWRIPHKGFLECLARLMLSEAIDPNTCRYCYGVAEIVRKDGKRVICDGCKGVGKKPLTDEERAYFCGLKSGNSWYDTWGERYRRWQMRTIYQWEDDFRRA